MSAKTTIIGRVHSIGQATAIGQNGSFKRSIVIDMTRQNDQYKSFVEVEFWNDRTAQLDQFVPMQLVQIEGFAESRFHEGSSRWFTSVRGWTIQEYMVPSHGQQNQQVQQPIPQPAPQPRHSQPVTTLDPSAFYSQQPVQQPQPGSPNPNQGPNDLPWI